MPSTPAVGYDGVMDTESVETLWQFVRGDLDVAAFEAWLYAHPTPEQALGAEFYLDIASVDYRSRNDVYLIKERLESWLRPSLACECPALSDLAVVPMGGDGQDERVFATVDEICRHGGSQWWLSLSCCRSCGQNWMVAAEERMYDDYLLKRLSPETAEVIVATKQWPDNFLTYEKVLDTLARLSRACRFLDAMSGGLVYTVQDLKQERPDITSAEIARLMGLSVEHAEMLLDSLGHDQPPGT